MTWLRTDDGFTSHPKFEGWTPLQKWSFLELMHYCARYRTKGRVPADLSLLPRAVTPRLLTLAHRSKWLDKDENGVYWIHDWNIYNPTDETNAERQRRYRERNKTVTEGVTNAVTEGVTKTLPRAGASAAVPVPSSSKTLSALRQGEHGDSPNGTPTIGERDDELTKLLDQLGASEGDRRTAAADPSRAIATARFTLAQPDVTRPLAYYRKITATGLYPENAEHVTAGLPRPLFEVLTLLVRATGHIDTWAGVERDLAALERRRGEKLTDEQRVGLHELWQSLQPTDPVENEPT